MIQLLSLIQTALYLRFLSTQYNAPSRNSLPFSAQFHTYFIIAFYGADSKHFPQKKKARIFAGSSFFLLKYKFLL